MEKSSLRQITENADMHQKVCGIICEYNPFHLGHKWQIDELKSRGFAVVCIMSGSFVQRGEAAIMPKEARANAAVACGADLVLELPFPFSCFGAEKFARAGIFILESLGFVDSLAFGSECADRDSLEKAAELLLDEHFKHRINDILKSDKSLGFARARSVAMTEALGHDVCTPNDILAVEYIKAIKELGSGLVPLPIKRNAVGHSDSHADGFASASHIRNLLYNGDFDEAEKFVPKQSSNAFELAFRPDDKMLGFALATAVLGKGVDGLSGIAEVGGCEHSVYKSVYEACKNGSISFENIAKSLCAKHLTDAKIRRMMLFSLMGVTTSDMAELPAYTRVIASNGTGHELLKRAKKSVSEGFTIISGGSALAAADNTAKRQFAKNALAESLIAPSLVKLKHES